MSEIVFKDAFQGCFLCRLKKEKKSCVFQDFCNLSPLTYTGVRTHATNKINPTQVTEYTYRHTYNKRVTNAILNAKVLHLGRSVNKSVRKRKWMSGHFYGPGALDRTRLLLNENYCTTSVTFMLHTYIHRYLKLST